MKRLSIKAKIALMCTLLAAVTASLAIAVVIYNEQRVISSYFSDSLVSTAQLAQDDIRSENGKLEIDRNLDDLPNVRVAIFNLDGDLIYGQQRFEMDFQESTIRNVRDSSGVQWVLRDTRMEFADARPIWLRCYMASDALESMRGVRREVLLGLFPALILLAALGGWLIARRALDPLTRIIRTAEGIADGADLQKRIGLKGARDEIYQTAKVFDDMLARLEEAFERERRFTSDASHELRTPVAAIMAQCDYALSPAANAEDRVEALEEISRQGGRTSALIQRLLTLARLDARQRLEDLESVDLALLAEITADSIRERAQNRGMQVQIAAPEPAVVQGDQTMLIQAMLNLAENAVNYGREGGLVRIEAIHAGDACQISVFNDGEAIPVDQQKRIFDRFYQANAARGSGGFGLGLSLVARIVQLHGGRIDLYSAPDEGCRFTIVLPAAQKEEIHD